MPDIHLRILAGGPKENPVAAEVGRRLDSLPLSESSSLLECWAESVGLALREISDARLASAVMLVSERDDLGGIALPSGFEVERESRSHRGTAGAVADHLQLGECPRDALVIVAELSASPALRLHDLLGRAMSPPSARPLFLVGESSLRRHCGICICSRDGFDLVPGVGFVDLKEQMLPLVRSAGGEIDAVCVAPRALRLRTADEWRACVRAWSDFKLAGSSADVSARPAVGAATGNGSLIQPRSVTDGAHVISSIIMEDAVVEPGAVVARSVVGPGVRVKSGTRVIDTIRGKSHRVVPGTASQASGDPAGGGDR